MVCLDDSGGDFSQAVVFGAEDSGIALSAADGTSPVMDGTGTGFAEAIRLLDGVTDVTIEGLEIRYYTGLSCCGVGNSIQAWGVNTSNIVVQNNYMHDNNYSAILVGSEGAQTHSGWTVRNNTATDNATAFFSAQIELTNCSGCSIHRNSISGGAVGVLVQGRNTIPESGLVETKGVSVKNNSIANLDFVGVYILALASEPVPPFDPIPDAQSDLKAVSLVGNTIDVQTSAASGLWAFGFQAGDVINPALIKNEFLCDPDTDTAIGLFGNTFNAKVVNNDVNNGIATCVPLFDTGDSTKFPPVPDNPS